ncbi:MAG: alpha-amylase family glycosyl hydrolase [Bacteroidales bacterium]
MQTENTLIQLFTSLYGFQKSELIHDFIDELKALKKSLQLEPAESQWYKSAVIYSLYVDLFNKNFQGLTEKLDYICSLGVNTLWLLPILDSPMRDAGFDIRDYRSIRRELFSLPPDTPAESTRQLFRSFLNEVHARRIRVIFDIAMNHTSNEHPWFVESRKGPDNPYRDYYIWNKDTNLYKETRLLFKGLCPSNWEYDNGWYYFHRFYEFQPDLNYRNPKVLLEISRILAFWLSQGVDGFRADAIPFIWKEDGTDCENLPQTHTIVKFFRALLDFLRPGTLLLAEACQPPKEVVKYFGDGDECHAGYHFPLMPQIFISMATADAKPVQQVLSAEVTPPIPSSCQWFTFLRLHDELTLEMVTPAERDIMNTHYRHDMRWNFREGEGISARLAELFRFDERRVLQAYSIMLTLPGTPVIYYGDELGKGNDEAWFNHMTQITGHPDSRFYVRGPIDWAWAEKQLSDPNSFSSRIFNALRQMLSLRKQRQVFGQGALEWETSLESLPSHVLAFRRVYKNEELLAVHNLSDKPVIIRHSARAHPQKWVFSYGAQLHQGELFTFEPYGFVWLFND